METFNAPIRKEVKKCIYNRIPTGNNTFRTEITGQITKVYLLSCNEQNNRIRINNAVYKVDENREFTIQIKKTKINAIKGAKGLLEFLQDETLDIWIEKIMNNCKPIFS